MRQVLKRSTRAHRFAGNTPATAADPTDHWTVIKRDGRHETFDVQKIRHAIDRCLRNNCRLLPEESQVVAERVSARVVNFLDGQGQTEPGIEDVQRAVISQLWADGQFEAAEHYTLYREERRKLRESRPIPPDVIERINADAANFPTPLQAYQFYSKFSRWREVDKRRETWTECNTRVFDWFATLPQFHALKREEVDWLRRMMFEMKASPAMRVVQMAGPSLERCHMGAYNCTYAPVTDLFSFAELLYILMQGCGGGFSVETDYVGELPRVRRQKKNGERVVHKFTVPDSTDGWCDATHFGLQKWFAGEDVEYDFSLIRRKGVRLKTKGGRASGPGPLRDLLNFIRNIVLRAQGRHLTDLEVHDICCMIGKIVQVGGVRRASCISLSDLDSKEMRHCKHGEWWLTNNQRSMANNSAVYEERPPIDVFMEEWLALVKSRSGERGIFNRGAVWKCLPARRKHWRFGANPCLEIVLRPHQCCNLTIAVIRPTDTVDEIADKVRAATYFGVVQSCATNFKYVRKEWKENCEEERLLGVDMMGHLDHPLLCPGAPGREALVAYLKQIVREVSVELSERFGINPSTANTTLKPGGDSSVFFDSSTLSPAYGQYIMRRTREANYSPVCRLLKEAGVPWEPAAEDEANLTAFAWPKKTPDGFVIRHQMNAIQQLENWLFWKKYWAEHSCSVTVYVKEEEWFEVGAWLYQQEHWDNLTGVSFLPWDNGSYHTAPLEELTKTQYEEMVAKFPKIDWSKLMRFEDDDQTTVASTPACVGNSCSL